MSLQSTREIIPIDVSGYMEPHEKGQTSILKQKPQIIGISFGLAWSRGCCLYLQAVCLSTISLSNCP